MSLRLEGQRVERGTPWNKSYARLVTGGGVTADKVIPPLLSVVLDRRGRRHPKLVDNMTVGVLLARTSGCRVSGMANMNGTYGGVAIGAPGGGGGGEF